MALYCNVLEQASVEAALHVLVAKFGRVDVLINGAGGNLPRESVVPANGRFTDLDLDAVRQAIELNFMGTFIPCRVFCKYFAEIGRGVIINTSSMNAFTPLTNIPAYSAAKAAVTNLTRQLASQVRVDFPGAAIRVNEIAPGFLLTDQNRNLLLHPDGRLKPRAESVIRRTPMGRFGKPEELVGPTVYLIADASAFVTGTTVVIDGGYNACSGVGPLDEKDALFAQARKPS
jgi:NAD(P)-dependent dehydrogenase (short-subunit alcohol dehydrogenase family)